MTLLIAERICGLEIRLIPPPSKIGTAVTYAAFDHGVEVVRRTESGHSRTLSAVVETLYRRMTRRVFEEQGWRCFSCGSLSKGLTADHIIPRARGGRRDHRHLLRGVCQDCHRKITDNLIDPAPHPEVLARVQTFGWTWEPDSSRVGWHRLVEVPTLEREATA